MPVATHLDSLLSLLSTPPPPSERGPLARIPREQRVCHVCRTTPRTGGLRIEHRHGEVRITCSRCLTRTTSPPTLAQLREQLFRLQRELLEQQARALGYRPERWREGN